jgi:hypothetical protein
VICAKCHKLETALRPYDPSVGETSRTPGTSGTTNTVVVVGANTAHNSHHYDTKDGTDQCVSCHVAIPHGWTAPRLLVDVAKYEGTPYVSPNALEDMLTLAALNNHPIVPSSGLLPYVHSAGTVSSETTPTYDITRVGTVLWDESQCDACGDHFGNDVNHGGTGKNSTAVPVRIDEP